MHQRAASLAEIVASHELRVSTAPLLSASATAALPFGEAAVRASFFLSNVSRHTHCSLAALVCFHSFMPS